MQRNSILRSLLELLSFHLVLRDKLFFLSILVYLPNVLVPHAVLSAPSRRECNC